MATCKHCGEDVFEDGTDDPEIGPPKVIWTHERTGDAYCADAGRWQLGEPQDAS